MHKDVYLESIEFSTFAGSSAICSVRCTLSNKEGSPLFMKAGLMQSSKKVINFQANTKVSKVQASNDHGCAYVYRVAFLDRASNEIDTYNPCNQ